MALSNVQQGVIVQDEFAKFVTIGTGGLVELFAPLSDDQRVDFEAVIKRRFLVPLGIQVKSSTALERNGTLLKITFVVSDEALVTHDLFYYFMAYLDRRALGVTAPFFFVPSREVHKHVDPKRKRDGKRQIEFVASLQPNSRDQWSGYRFDQQTLGPHVIQVIRRGQRRGLVAATMPSQLFRIPGMLWGGTPARRGGG